MKGWFERLRPVWEEIAPPGEAPSSRREQPAGIPRPLQQATRFALAAALGVSLMSQVVGVRLVARVDADPGHRAACNQSCADKHTACLDTCKGKTGQARAACNQDCNQAHQDCMDGCKNL